MSDSYQPNFSQLPVFGGHPRERGRCFDALAQIIVTTAIPIHSEINSPSCKKKTEQANLQLQRLEKLLIDIIKAQKFSKEARTKTV